ncbi:hypothetical protein KP509_15G070600 [Ceratopteris richardii]|uniref:Uncharacterized protein n=1 Tax=Ceratopteris richardii TaxID=49495 RepID=A0A8T2T4L5_CERRI|nr:hypothetical protein KP509_15G070600 [Ceratopteris richardii]
MSFVMENGPMFKMLLLLTLLGELFLDCPMSLLVSNAKDELVYLCLYVKLPRKAN